MNSLVVTVTPLLTLLIQLRHSVLLQNVSHLRTQIIDEIHNIENKLKKLGYSPRTVIATRYCLCTALDETVLSRPWSEKSMWVQQSLLGYFHNERWGGERFYIILEEMVNDSKKNMDFLEFAFTLLSLGFEGKYYGEQLAIREEIRKRVFYRIRQSQVKPDHRLSRNLPELNDLGKHKFNYNHIATILMITLVLFITLYGYYNHLVYQAANPLLNQLNKIAAVSPITIFNEEKIQKEISG